MAKPTLTTDERRVFELMKQNAEDVAGGDFGIMDEVNYKSLKLTGQQFGALVTSLQTKGYLTVHEPVYVNNREKVVQFTIDE
jgi:hypothetical protein